MSESDKKVDLENLSRTDDNAIDTSVSLVESDRIESPLDTLENATVYLGNFENYNQFIKNKKVIEDSLSPAGRRVFSLKSVNDRLRSIFKEHCNFQEIVQNIRRNFVETLNFWKWRKNGIFCVLIPFLCFYLMLLSRNLTETLIALFLYLACIYIIVHVKRLRNVQQLFLLFIASMGVLVGSYNQYVLKQYYAESIEEWITYFIEKRFDRCDDLAYGTTDLILPINDGSTGSIKNSDDMYLYLLDSVVDDIEGISYNDVTHKITVRYRVYKDMEKITIDGIEVSELRDKYIASELSDEDFKESIQRLYMSSFKNSVLSRKTDKTVETSVEMTLIDGKVEGGYTLVQEILYGSGVYNNIERFESDIKSTIDVLIRSEE